MKNNIIEIMPLTPVNLPKDYFDNRGRLISTKNYLLKMQRKIKKMSGVINFEMLEKNDKL